MNPDLEKLIKELFTQWSETDGDYLFQDLTVLEVKNALIGAYSLGYKAGLEKVKELIPHSVSLRPVYSKANEEDGQMDRIYENALSIFQKDTLENINQAIAKLWKPTP